MHQVLFWIPINIGLNPKGIPIYGFGTMLFVGFLACAWYASRRAAREGIDKDRVYDLAFWIFLFGIIFARIVYMIQYKVPFEDFYKIWQGGIVWYGGAVGGWIGYGVAHYTFFRKYKISMGQVIDIAAPTICIGLAIGRVGCLMNGCCYGHVCSDNGLQFPTLTAPARELVVSKGMQTLAGFAIDRPVGLDATLPLPARVKEVEPGSPAAEAGLKHGDVIQKVNGLTITDLDDLSRQLLDDWPRGQASMTLTVVHDGTTEPTELKPFTPRTLPLHPTQVYETISMMLMFGVLITFLPYRTYYGQLFPPLMIMYAFHRFMNETLRTDTNPVLANLTLSQVGSILVLIAGVVFWLYLWKFSPRVGDKSTAAPPQAKT